MKHYHEAIQKALNQRYRVDVETGVIYGPKGPLKIVLRGVQRYPTVSLSLVGEAQVVVPAHKVVAFALYGDDAFNQIVRHMDDDPLNLHPSNIRLGTHSENNMDKPPEVRRAAAVKARAAQGFQPHNAQFTHEQAAKIRAECVANLNPNGRLKRGVGTRIAQENNVTRFVISSLWKGKNYGGIKND